MRLIKVTGGLGNQMFMYALYIAMKKTFPNTRLDLSDMQHYHAHHGYEMNHVFNLPKTEFCINQKLKKVLEFLFFKTILERKQKGSLDAYRKPIAWPFIYFKGFYQSERYFKDVEADVRKVFTFNSALFNEKSKALLQLLEKDECSVSLHVRRGDYLQPKFWKNNGSVCQLPYYHNAVKAMAQHVASPHYYVFSDDIEWVRENLPLPHATFIDWNKGKESWQDMMLMSHCRHNIICNSTFSWWGAWLNAHPGKIVVTPNRWYASGDDPYIVPKGWLRVPTSE